MLNGRYVSGLDLTLIQTLFAEQTLNLCLRRDGPPPQNGAFDHPVPPPAFKLKAKSSSGALNKSKMSSPRHFISLLG